MAQQGGSQKSTNNRGFGSMEEDKKQNPKAQEFSKETRQASDKSEGAWKSDTENRGPRSQSEESDEDEQSDLGNRASQSDKRDDQREEEK